jgi:iron(III) transport system permease protein
VLWPAVRALPREHLDAAAIDGCSPAGQIGKVAVPLTTSALIAAWGVAFVLALGELPATNLVHPPGVEPLSCVIWEMMHRGVDSHLAGVALVMLATIGTAGLAAAWSLARLVRR